MHRKLVFKMAPKKHTAPKLPPSSPKKRFPCMIPQGKYPSMPKSGSDSSSSDSDSDSSDSIQLVEEKKKKKSDDAADSDVEVLENERAVAAAFSPDADVVELASMPGSSASEETRRHLKYQRRYRLVREPVGDWTHDERAKVSFGFSV
jgi:hypothetical protein